MGYRFGKTTHIKGKGRSRKYDKCPVLGKSMFVDIAEVSDALKIHKERGHAIKRYYLCPHCDNYHLTSEEKREP